MRRTWILAVVLVVLAVAVTAWVTTRPTAVVVLRPSRGPLVATLVASGRLEPATRVSLGFESLGTVVSVPVSEGAAVRRGELLVQIDDAIARAAVEQARAQLAQAEASLARLRGHGARVASVDVRTAEIALESARARESRESRLIAGGGTTTASFEDATRARMSAEAALERVREQSRTLGRDGEDVRVALAAREGAQAALRSAQTALDRTALRAPFDGIVLSRDVEPGEVVAPGGTLLELASSGPGEIVLNADETHLAWIALGQRADVAAESFPDRRFHAEVVSIAPAVDPLRGTIEVKLRPLDPPPELRPDMTVSVEIETGRAQHALVLPTEVVHDLTSDRPWVWVVHEGAAIHRDVRLGLRGDDRVAIVTGLRANESVIRADAAALVEGQRVRARRGG